MICINYQSYLMKLVKVVRSEGPGIGLPPVALSRAAMLFARVRIVCIPYASWAIWPWDWP